MDELTLAVDGRPQVRVVDGADFHQIDRAAESLAQGVGEVEVLIERRGTAGMELRRWSSTRSPRLSAMAACMAKPPTGFGSDAPCRGRVNSASA